MTNDYGKRCIEFAGRHGLEVTSTLFEDKRIHKVTWMSPDGKTQNQIDHILIEERDVISIKNVRSYRGPDADSDHFMVGAAVKQNQCKRKKVYRTQKRF